MSSDYDILKLAHWQIKLQQAQKAQQPLVVGPEGCAQLSALLRELQNYRATSQGKLRLRTTKRIRDIVGIGGISREYEDTCQTMLQAGYDYTQLKKGCVTDESVKRVCLNAVHNNCSGAQIHAVLDHLRKIYVDGVDTWIEEARRNNQLLSQSSPRGV